MNTCPSCGSNERQVKNGETRCGSQRYWCKGCGRRYTPDSKPHAYPPEMHATAMRMHSDGCSLRGIARHLGVAHPTVGRWITARNEVLPARSRTPVGPVDVDNSAMLRKQAW